MASLKCSKCGYGIHYHDEPDGTEWIAFESELWRKLCESTKELSSYTSDSPSGWYSVWKCSECGTLHVFKMQDIHLFKAFEPVDKADDNSESRMNLIAFEDIIWDQITETDKTGKAFGEVFREIPRKYICATETAVFVYRDPERKILEACYKKIES